MLNLSNKNIDKKHKNFKFKKLSFLDIINFYTNKNHSDLLYGLEYERLSLDKNTLQNADYPKLEKIIKHFASILNWELIFDNETLIGAKNSNLTSISLEPGCQLEISISPKKDILEIDLELNKIISLINSIGEIYDVIFLGYGISPVSNVDNIRLLNKKRYRTMDKFLPKRELGELSQKMMRQSAGIQINLDFKNSKDAYNKLKFFNLISPFCAAFFANSPFENNSLNDKKSIRTHVWQFTGKERCNIFYKNIFNKLFANKNTFKNYIFSILEVPMIFIEREEKIVEINGEINFKQFIKNGYKNYKATFKDYILHQSLCFPDVRLKKYIEIRNHDSSNPKIALALCAFYKGLNQSDIKKNLKHFNYLKIKNIENYSKELVKNGLEIKIEKNIDGWKIMLDLFNIAKQNLNTQEKIYLEPILNIIKKRRTQADEIMRNKPKNAFELLDLLSKY